MRYLIVASHPDDEVLGAGAMMHKASGNGDEIYVCLLSHWSPTRDDNLAGGIASSHAILGVKKSYVGDFGCMRFKDEDHHAIVRFIESVIVDCQPDVLITHHGGCPCGSWHHIGVLHGGIEAPDETDCEYPANPKDYVYEYSQWSFHSECVCQCRCR